MVLTRNSVLLVLVGLLLGATCTPQGSVSVPPVTVPPATAPQIDPDATAVPVGGPFRYGIAQPRGIVPPDALEPADLAVTDALFDSLLAVDADGGLEASAAVAWGPREQDASVWTFTLRPGATFHNGAAVTAGDFAFSWTLAVRRGAAGYHLRDVVGYPEVVAGMTEVLAGVVVVDDLTLEVHLEHPRADFPWVVAHPALGPIPRADWEARTATGVTPSFTEQPTGNGPFEMQGPWAPRQFVRTERFDGWRNGALPELTSVLFDIGDVDSHYLAFQQGRLDYTALPPEAIGLAREEYPHQPAQQRPDDLSAGTGFLSGPVPTSYFLAFRMDRAPFDNLSVRQALAGLIDRAAVAEAFFDGNLEPADGLVPPGVPGRLEGACAWCLAEPPDLPPNLRRIDFAFNAGAGHEDVAEILARDLAAVGVDFEAPDEPPRFDDYLADVREGRYGFFRWGWAPEYATLDEALYPLLHSSQTPEAGGQNVMGYANPAVDSVLDRARRELDQQRRIRLYRLAERIALNADQPLLPVVTYREAAVVAERVRGLVLDPAGRVNLAELDLD